MSIPENGVSFRLHQVEQRTREDGPLDNGRKLAEKHEYELHGDRGVNATLKELAGQIRWLNRALWGLAASVTVAAIVFALGSIGHP